MIVVNIYGGIGNQMFQYAFGRSLAVTKNTVLKLDISPFQTYNLRTFSLDKFSLSYQLASYQDILRFKLSNKYKRYILRQIMKYTPIESKIYFEKNPFNYDPNVFYSKSVYYAGYWQSYKYFSPIRNLLLKDFTIKDTLDDDNKRILDKIQNVNSVSLHIRRGDYITLSKRKNGNVLCPISYYHHAIEYLAKRIEAPRFFIFSDDIAWVKKYLKIGFETEYMDFNHNSPEKDINLIKHCKHNIIANSTFSWWGAWLNENLSKIVIAPKKWMNNLNSPTDLIDPIWIQL